MRVADLEAIKIKIASAEEILSWSFGEVTKPETINYRTQRAEKDGLFCERIFGPEKDYECYCGKYKRIRYKGVICDRCGVEVTKSSVRRERMGHVKLACPVSHIWYLRGVPSRMGRVLDMPMHHLEKVIYFASYIITKVNEEEKENILKSIDKEYKRKAKDLNTDKKNKEVTKEDLKKARDVARSEVSSLTKFKVLSEVEYYKYSSKYGEAFEAGTGAGTLRKIFEEINLKEEIKNLEKEMEKATPAARKKMLGRLRFFQNMEEGGIRPEWMFMTVVPVLPPDLRPMVQLDGGRYASSDLNDLYRRVINRNNRLKHLLEIGAPEVIVRNEKRMLQEAVDALIDNGMRKGVLTTATTGGRRLLKSLADMLKGKQGRFRQNLLGKRVDYSGRSVIVVGPKLKLHQCGLPKKMALELFKPFVIKEILEKELAYNVRGASRLIEEETDEVWGILEGVVKNRLVLLNRAPTLHRLGIQAFQPVLIEGESIQLHPLVCKAFNADFDGDQMAVHLPLSDKAQEEAKSLMHSVYNLLKPATGIPIVAPTQDIVLGCYWSTVLKEGVKGEGRIFASPEEAILAYNMDQIDLRAKIKVFGMKEEENSIDEATETSVGRILFNYDLPEDWGFVNEEMTSKKLERLVSVIIEKYDQETVEKVLDKIKETGFKYSTISGITWGMSDLVVPKEKKKIMEEAEGKVKTIDGYFTKGLLSKEERNAKIIEVWTKVKSEIEQLVPDALPQGGSVSTIIKSGSRGSWSQPVQMAGMKGLVINPAGQIIELPVRSSFKEGFNVLEYFISTHGARKGTADTALRTSTAGYLTRRLVDVAHEVIVSEKDCGTTRSMTVRKEEAENIGQDFALKIVGRVVSDAVKDGRKTIVKKGDAISWEKAREIEKRDKIEEVSVRSPLVCQSKRGVCQKCYGWDLGRNKLVEPGAAVGVIAAQAIGEPGTQLTMRTFHTGGVAGGSGDITFGLPRVQEIFEARKPKGKAEIIKDKGKVVEIDSKKGVVKIKGTSGEKKDVIEYKVPEDTGLLVKKGDSVEKGQQLFEGSLDLKELYRLGGRDAVQDYILKEIQNIYASQGAVIHDKHIEVIVRQMFSRIKVKDSGDTKFTDGQLIEMSSFDEENEKVKKDKKKEATGKEVLLGISRVALSTDSFLSAASFQETSRVLIRASLEGKVDKLRGLKENVIIGKLIPAGTGFKK